MQKIIAVLDDELEMKEIYSLLLEEPIEKGLIDFRFFSDSRYFVKWLDNNELDILVTDINMPFISGTEILKIIKKNGRDILTYFISGHDERDFTNIMKDFGVNRFISKPINAETFLEELQLNHARKAY